MLKESVSVKKKKTAKPVVKIEIDDDNLINLYKKNLVLQEAIIQERVKLTGTKKNIDKFSQLLSEFLEKN
ncbi:SCP2 sterol-binding domain-containing protein [Polaribacter filamentus]|uniref:SCP2 sterol-binding domain-containing protein n=1 Tax=Polaribacter filamentus TaxID=53483 RepID=UPI0011B02066